MRSELEPRIVTVAIVTTDPLVRSALAASLGLSDELDLVAEIAQADVVLWDPGLAAGTERYGELAAFGAPTAVLSGDPEQAGAAIEAGARAVLAREIDPAALCAALLAIDRGLTVLDRGAHERLWPEAGERAPREDAPAPFEELTAREREVLQLLAAGMSNRAIARELDISEHTAKFHVNGILGKLGASSRTEAVVAAARRALVIL
jgi:DNA-binding NarL/FixJ family response regulator